MSSFLYGSLERKRTEAPAGTSTTASSPGVRTYADSLAALVPAEALALYAVLLQAFSDQTTPEGDATAELLTITDPTAATWAVYGCLVLSSFLFLSGKYRVGGGKSFDLLDVARAVIPPLAFLGWLMLTSPLVVRTAAADAWIIGDASDALLQVIALLSAGFLGVLAAFLGYKADQASPPGD